MPLTLPYSSRAIIPKRHLDLNQPEEVVDDSEPEREEARKRRKEERRKRKGQAKADTILFIELTDSNSPGTTRIHASRVTNDVLAQGVTSSIVDNLDKELSTGYDRDRSGVSMMRSMKTSTVTKPACPPDHAVNVPDSQSPGISDSGHTSDETDEKTVEIRTKLGSFAFSAVSQAGSSSEPTKRMKHSINPPKVNPTHLTGSAKVYLNFSDHQLKSLLKCVSCDLKWTTRKSSGNKVTHMRTCAKKARLREDTMTILISREISTAYQMSAKRRPGTDGDHAPKTLLQDLVKDVDCPRPGKRQKEIPNSVKAISESRDDILERAKSILDGPHPGRSTKDELANEASPSRLATQKFGKSRLAASLAGSSYSKMDDEPPLTQALPGSSLGSTFSVRRTTSHTYDMMTEGPSATQMDSPKVTTARCSGSSLLSSEFIVDAVSSRHLSSLKTSRHLPEDSNLTHNPDDVFLCISEDDNCGDSGATLVFDPAIREDICDPIFVKESVDSGTTFEDTISVQIPTARLPSIPPSDILRKAGLEHIWEDSSREGDLGSAGTADRTVTEQSATDQTGKPISPRKRRPKCQNIGNEGKENGHSMINDEELYEKFKAMVLEDETLYRRILCYEPIRIETFLDMAQDHAKEYKLGSPVLKFKLKAFLDQQAIHYCEGSWNRR